jgi:hypothetical protein
MTDYAVVPGLFDSNTYNWQQKQSSSRLSLIIDCEKNLKIPKGQSEDVIQKKDK